MRIRKPEFSVSRADWEVYVNVPSGWNGPTIEAIKQVKAQGASLLLYPEAIDHSTTLILNWGAHYKPFGLAAVLNKSEAVAKSSNQTACLKALGDIAPPTWNNFIDCSWPTVAKRNHGSHGRGKRVWKDPAALVRYLKRHERYDVYQQFIPNNTEWRVHVFKDKVIGAMRKIRMNNEPPTDLRPEFQFHRVQIIPDEVAKTAVESAKRVGLDFAGVDIIRDEDTQKYYCLETNSAPGMSPETVRRLYASIQNHFRS